MKPRMNAHKSEPGPEERRSASFTSSSTNRAVAVSMKRHAVAQPRRHGALVVIEEVRSLGAESEQIAVRLQDFLRPLPEGAAKRGFRKEEMGEVGRHDD